MMRKLSVFESVSLDGYFTDAKSDLGWAHEGAQDPELMAFTKANAQGTNALVLGRVTYQQMAAFWPTEPAARSMPDVAGGMNRSPKVVFSRTLASADWANTTLLAGDPATEIARLKKEPGPESTLLG